MALLFSHYAVGAIADGDVLAPRPAVGIPATRLLCVLFGLGSAVIIGLVGLHFGGLMLLLAFPLVFRTASRVAPAWLVATSGTSWLILVATGTGTYVRNSLTLDNGPVLTAMGVAPLVFAAL
jgi:hypothetical protein